MRRWNNRHRLSNLKDFPPVGYISHALAALSCAEQNGRRYSETVIVEETKEEGLTKEELERLHISIGINHSMVEYPALFLVLGIEWFLVVVT